MSGLRKDRPPDLAVQRYRTMLKLKTVPALACIIAAAGLTGCASDPTTGNYARVGKGSAVTANPSQYSDSLTCLRQAALKANIAPPRVAVGRIADLTGKYDLQSGSPASQGASLYAMTALGKAGLGVVERYDTSISDVELKYASAHQLSDNPDAAGQDPDNYRKILAGQIAGSDYYIVGGITELNYNLSSGGVDAGAGEPAVTGLKGTFQHRTFTMNVAVDLRLVDTRSQEVVDMVSLQKKLVGKEIKAGIFDYGKGAVIDISGGKSSMEPVQLGIRSIVERAVYMFSMRLYGLSNATCLAPGDDGGPIDYLVPQPQAKPEPTPRDVPPPPPPVTQQTDYALSNRLTWPGKGN